MMPLPLRVPSTAKRPCLHLGPAVAAATSHYASSEDAAAMAGALSTDVIFEIMSWMPAKSLCRFQCVSRPWRGLLSDPAFVAAHESRAEPLLVGSFRLGASLRLMDTEGNVVRSMAGVDGCWTLCTSLDSLACFTDEHSPDPQVVDLATGKMLLTRPTLDDDEGAHGWFGYQMYSPRRYGFGFGRAASSRVYKVVRLKDHGAAYHNAAVDQTCEVLTLGDSSGWRQAHAPTTSPVSLCYYQSSVAIDGVVHFLALNENSILRFDLETEAWSKAIQGPWEASLRDPSETTRNVNIAELNGDLCMVQTKVRTSGNSYTDVWQLTDPDSSVWSRRYTIHMARAVDLVKPLRVMREGEKLLFYYSQDNSPPVMQMYDPRDETCTDVTGTATGLTGTIVLCNLRLPRFSFASSSLL